MAGPKTRQSTSSKQDIQESADTIQPQTSLAADASPSSPEVLRTLYAVLLKTRLLQEHSKVLVRTGKIPGTDLPVLGGEATEVGACIGLQPDDSFSSSCATFAPDVVKNTPLQKMFTQLLGDEKHKPATLSEIESGAVHVLPSAFAIAGRFDIAAGVALAYRQLGKPNVVVVLAADGLAALGFWHDAASLAARHRLPIVFMIEVPAEPQNNGHGVVNSAEDLRDRAEAYGFPGITVDGSDIVAVWRVTQESIHRARTGAGPTLIECRTRRWYQAFANLSSSRRSDSKRIRERLQTDPLRNMEHYMKKRNLWRQSLTDALVEEYRASLSSAFASAEESFHHDRRSTSRK
jgi:pyruvate dehydrogenase E1 component alpha subunit